MTDHFVYSTIYSPHFLLLFLPIPRVKIPHFHQSHLRFGFVENVVVVGDDVDYVYDDDDDAHCVDYVVDDSGLFDVYS